MGAVQTLHVSSLQTVGGAIGGSLRFTFLAVLYFIVFAAGGSLVAPYLPATPAQAGPVPELTGLLIVCVAFLPANASHIHHRSMATPYQLLRTLIWVAGAYPIIRGSRLPLWQTALLVGLALSVRKISVISCRTH
jgi:hypothetical protein